LSRSGPDPSPGLPSHGPSASEQGRPPVSPRLWCRHCAAAATGLKLSTPATTQTPASTGAPVARPAIDALEHPRRECRGEGVAIRANRRLSCSIGSARRSGAVWTARQCCQPELVVDDGGDDVALVARPGRRRGRTAWRRPVKLLAPEEVGPWQCLMRCPVAESLLLQCGGRVVG